MKLAYEACDLAGRSVRDVIEAADADEASQRLRRKGLFVTDLRPADAPGKAKPAGAARGWPALRMPGGGGDAKRLSLFTRQMHMLLSTGTPVVDALASVGKQVDHPAWSVAIADARHAIEQGGSLADALRKHPRFFDAVYVGLIEAGEASGKLSPVLAKLSSLTQKRLRTRNALAGAMVYPALLLCIGGSVLLSTFVFVLPRFGEMFDSLGVPMPVTTQAMLEISALLRGYWWALLPAALAAAAGGVAVLRSKPGRAWVAEVAITLPLFGTINRGFVVARVVRLIGVLLDSGLPMLDVLQLVRNAAGSPRYAALLDRAADDVRRGEAISGSFTGTPLVPVTVGEGIRIGEQTGQLSRTAVEIADFLDDENDTAVKTLTSVLEPLILVVLGGVVGLVSMSLFLPLFDVAAIGGG